MSITPSRPGLPAADAFGRAVAARLDAGTQALPHEVQERLRAARQRALLAQREAVARQAPRRAGRAPAQGQEPAWPLWHRLASVLPLLLLAAGLVFLHGFQADRRDDELADLDAALLTDDLPPAAYADPGFAQFLRSGRGTQH